MERFGKEVMQRRLRVRRHKQKNNKGWVSANNALKSDPINGQGIPSHFQATLDQLEHLYDGLQLHYGNERLGKKWKLK